MLILFRKYFLSSYSGFSIKTWVTIFATFVNSIGSSVSVFMALYLSIVLHFPVRDIAYVVSASGLGMMVGSFVGGFLCDRFDAYKVSVVMLIASGISTCSIMFFSHFTVLMLLMFINGLCYGIFRPANTINLLQDCSATDRARINGLSRVAVNLGIGTASMLGGILLSISYKAIFLFDSIASWLAALTLICFSHLFISTTKRQHKTQHDRLSTSLWADKITIVLCLILFLNGIVFFQSWTTYALYLNKYYHFSANQFGYLFLLNCLMIVFLEVPILNAVKNYNQFLIAAIGSLFLCCSFIILPFSTHAMIAIFSCIILTIGEVLLYSTLLVIVINRSNEANKGKYVGLYQSLFAASNMLAPILGSYIYTISPALLWYSCALIGVLCVIAFQFMKLYCSRFSDYAVLQSEIELIQEE